MRGERIKKRSGLSMIILALGIFALAFFLGCCQARKAGMDQAARQVVAEYPDSGPVVETLYDRRGNPELNIITEQPSQTVYDKNWNVKGHIIKGQVYDRNWNRVGSIRKLR
jgi:hypothetical protein